LKYGPSSHGSNKLVIKAKVHAKTYFWIFCVLCIKKQYDFFVVWKYDAMIFLIFEIFGRMHEKQNHFLFFHKNFFAMFWRKPDVLILDLYPYSIKIQTSIKQFW
jgi:hypothetical protein